MNSQLNAYSKALQSRLTDLNWSKIGDNLINKFGTLILSTVIFLLILWVGKLIIDTVFKQTRRIEVLGGFKRAATFRAITLNIFRYTTYFCYLYAVLSIIGVPVGTLIAGAGIFSIALGLGAQGFVSDVVNGFFILLEKQLDVGDVVEINKIKGTVTGIGMRTTKILSADGTLNFVPNRSISVIKNFSRHANIANIDLKIKSDTNLDRVRQIIEQENLRIMKEQQVELKATPEIIGPVNVNGQLVFRVAVNKTNQKENKITPLLLSAYLEALTKGGIALPD